MKKIIYTFENRVHLLLPALDCGYSIKEIGDKDVPIGIPYKIIEDEDLPSEIEYIGTWELGAFIPDGYGIGPEAFFAKRTPPEPRKLIEDVI